MSSAHAGSLQAMLAAVPDPRGRKGRRFSLAAILTSLVCGVLCGIRNLSEFIEWLHELEPAVWHWMGFTRRPPKWDCVNDLLRELDPAAWEAALMTWMQAAFDVDPAEFRTFSMDGKTLCGSLRQHQGAVTLLAFVDHETGLVFRQCRVPENTNEHKAALAALRDMVLENRLVVADAAFAQRDVCQQIIDSGGDYLVTIKENQPQLHRDAQLELTANEAVFSPLPTA